ncbi:phosphoribosylformylglycinamidine cyclo-ligase [Candidatus Bipolaricaulota bacterium]|nr:phosphoribosylformylglycinamidine cyclo-ligase [Candidatus Bipolaricaulota bacterium]TFH11537.1 MAG: phosphoribosylformylglycinamidine cyclo-ligase [Candidatus Atribacteria bacterium]
MTERRVDSVSQDLNDRCSSIAQAWAKTTFPDTGASAQTEGDFSHAVLTPSGPIAITSDGIGTKVEIAERMSRYDTLGFDLVAMVVDDLVAGSARPMALSNILDVDRFDEEIVDALMKGLAAAARTAGVIVAGGEIAQLGQRISGYGNQMHVNWCATAIGVPLSRIAAADRPPRSGDRVVALASDGFRSNGFTLARSILETHLGEAWHNASSSTGMTWGDCLLTPSRIYAPAIMRAVEERIPILACAHITGGGIPGNLPRVLPKDARLRVELDDLWPPHSAMRELMQMSDIAPQALYEQWNMGSGFICIVPPDVADEMIAVMQCSGVRARVAGSLMTGEGIHIDARSWGMGELHFGGQG